MHFYTIGHYNHSIEQFLQFIKSAGIDFVADVRSFPGSRRIPHFNKTELRRWLKEADLSYRHFKNLGGRRKLSSEVGEELNAGWKNRSFHNYADYSLTEDFQVGMDELMAVGMNQRVVLMCSERHPARCHRLIISNYLKAIDKQVTHIVPDSNGEVEFINHELGKWGAAPVIEENGTVVYPELL